MKPKNGRIVIIQASLVLLMSAAAACSILQIIGTWTSLLIGVLLLTGALMIVFPRIGALPFSLLTFISSLPAILSHNILDIGKFTYQGFSFLGSQPITRDTALEIPFWTILSIGLFLISGYLVLSYLNSLQKDYQTSLLSDMNIIETKNITGRNTIVVMFPLLAGLLAALLIIPLNVVQPAVTEYMQNFPWSIIIFGLISVLLVSGLIYWIGIFKHKNISEE